MIVACTCGAKLKIRDEKLTDAGVKITCPKCGTAHHLRRPAPASAEPPAIEPAMPWFAPSSIIPSAPAAAAAPLVLVAHDSKVVADMIENVVKDAGMVTEHATDGLEALKKATTLKPQIMIVDVGLTGIYGFELCERLKGDPDTRDIKIILLSSVYGLTAYKRSPVTLYGADDYIEKHHIPDRLVPKLQRLLSGQPAEPMIAPGVSAGPDEPARPALEPAPMRAVPPVSEKGVPVVESRVPAAVRTQDSPVAAEVVPRGGQSAQRLADPDIPDVLPKVPVTLDQGRRRRPVSATQPEAATTSERQKPIPAGAKEALHGQQDDTIRLDAAFFEQDEYQTPVKAVSAMAADPAEVEKARKFARLIVSDIALYNQEAVAEGLRKGTFYELLHDDITEGRAVYERRVPEVIRATKDYYQEAFDTFIAAKKKQH